jgi:hypothetical protein
MSDLDDKIDSAWRAASREQPAAALDDAIRAAARRAVGSGPSLPSRVRHMRSWPLAAAAVVAVLAVGIVQLTPPEQVTPSEPVAPTIVADSTPRRDAARERDAGALPAPAVDVPAPRVAEQIAASPAAAERPSAAPRKQVMQPAAAPPPVPPPAPSFAPADKPQTMASAAGGTSASGAVPPARSRDAADAKSKLETLAPSATPRQERAEPFPAAAESKKAADVQAPAPDPAPPPATLAAANSTARMQTEESASGIRAARVSQAPAAAPMMLAKASPQREKDAAPRTPEEWVKLMRRLQSEGRKDDVIKELAAFRAEYKERADALLPADLRELK